MRWGLNKYNKPVKKGIWLQLIEERKLEEKRQLPGPIQELVNQFADVFWKPQGLPTRRVYDHSIPLLPNTQPVSVRPYRNPYFQKEEIEKIIQELLKNGVIQPSQSPYSSSILLVKKADGSWRMCVYYRALNKATIKVKFPIPIIEELPNEVFSKLDLHSNYHQIKVSEENIPKTAFRTHEGHYEFLVISFRLTNASSTFQNFMNNIFRPYLRKFILVFFDDILVYNKTAEDHV